MENSTKTIQTTNKHKVVIKVELNAREYRELRQLFIGDVVIDDRVEEGSSTGYTGAQLQKAEDGSIKLLIMSLDDSKEDILDRILELPVKDYQEIWEQALEVIVKYQQKKTD